MRGRRAARAVAVACALLPGAAVPAQGAPLAATKVSAPVLAFPSALAVAPDGRIFFGERLTGRIGWVPPRDGAVRTFATIPIAGTFTGRGLMSLAFHPGYPQQPYVYVSLARSVGGVPRVQLARLTDTGGRGTGLRVFWQTSVGDDHNATRVAFGPDGMVYLAVGDAADPARSQDLGDPHGKILRMGPTGAIPSDNPYPGTRVWASGFRNTIGMAFDPRTGRLWETENGPDCNDEVNRVERARNYGWGPTASCATGVAPWNTNRDGPAPTGPRAWYAASLGPTGAAFCTAGCRLGAGSAAAFFFGAWNTGQIRMLALTANRLGVRSQEVVYGHPRGVLAVESDRRGAIVFSDASAVYRLRPAQSSSAAISSPDRSPFWTKPRAPLSSIAGP
jgi:glucose/arabinose dehydrogenase